MSSYNPSSSLANSIKRSGNKTPLSSPPEAKKVPRPDGSSRPVTSSGKPATSSSGTPATSAARPEKPRPLGQVKDEPGSKGKAATLPHSASRSEKPRPLGQVKDESGSKGKAAILPHSASRPEKSKQPVSGVKKEEPGLKGKETVRSPEVKRPTSISSSKPVNAVAKPEVKNKAPASTSKTDTKSTKTAQKTGTRKKAEKKVYSLPGQKHDPPEEREPLRIFYESLSKQIPTSEMAEFWMMEHGLLPPEKAKKAFEKKQRKQHQLRTGTPVKVAVKFEKPESSKKPQSVNNGDMKAKKRIDYSDDDDDDFIFRRKKVKV